MKRRINLVGQNTLTISLPAEWVKKNDLKKGQDLEIIIKDKELIVLTNPDIKNRKEIYVDLSDVKSATILNSTIIRLYMMGYKKITIKHDKNVITNPFYKEKSLSTKRMIEKTVSDLSGVEITESSEQELIMEEITNPSAVSFNNIFRRGFLLLLEFSESRSNNEKAEFNIFEEYYDMDKYFKLAIKVLNVTSMDEELKERYLLLVNNLQLIGYNYSIFKATSKKKNIQEVRQINGALRTFYNICFKPGLQEIGELAGVLNDIQGRLKNGKFQSIGLIGVVNILKLSIINLPINEVLEKNKSTD